MEIDLSRPRAIKPKGKITPRAWSMAQMRQEGYRTGSTEMFEPHSRKRQDLFGFIDFIAIGHYQIIGVQCCVRGDVAPHRTKMVIDCFSQVCDWLDCGGLVQLHAWDRIEETTEQAAEFMTKISRRCEVESILRVDIDRLREAYFMKCKTGISSEGSPF